MQPKCACFLLFGPKRLLVGANFYREAHHQGVDIALIHKTVMLKAISTVQTNSSLIVITNI